MKNHDILHALGNHYAIAQVARYLITLYYAAVAHEPVGLSLGEVQLVLFVPKVIGIGRVTFPIGIDALAI
jgi:hypothetical protein